MEKVDLKPRHDLLDAEFEGYKLSLDPVVSYETKLEGRTTTGLRVRQADDEQFSFLHVKLFGSVANILVRDPHDDQAVYLLDADNEAVLQVVDRSADNQAPEVLEVWSSPDPGRALNPGDYNTSLSFPDPGLAVFADGRGCLYILKTDDRRSCRGRTWTTIFHDEVCGARRPFAVSSSCLTSPSSSPPGGIKTLTIILNYVEERSKLPDLKGFDEATFVNVVEVLSFVEPSGDKTTCIASWNLDQVRKFAFTGTLDYLEFSRPTCSGFYCLTEKPFKMFYDSSGMPEDEVVEEDKKEEVKKEEPLPSPPFYWHQGVEDMVIWVVLPPDATKRDIKVIMKPSEIQMKFKGDLLFGGKLWNVLDGDSMTWTIQKGRLEINVSKANVGMIWQRFLRQDNPELINDGFEITDPKELEGAIKHFSSCSQKLENQNEVMVEQQQQSGSVYNAQELEDCDEAPDESFSFFFVNLADGKATHRASCSGRQLICQVPGPEVSGLCLRHDVDGLVWQPSTDETSPLKIEHRGTFSALGYVQASKQMRKFTCASPDLSFAAICDVSRHIYVYRQPASISSGCELRNRKSGQKVEKVAKQQVITLQENNEDILGAVATSGTLFVVTLNTVFAIRINNIL